MKEEMTARMYERQTEWARVQREMQIAAARKDGATPPERRNRRLGDIRAILGLSGG